MKQVTQFINLSRLLLIVIVGASLTGCAGFNRKLKDFLGGSGGAAEAPVAGPTKFSDTPNVTNNVRRQYKRVTRQTLEEESQLEGRAGSLWVMEGQGSYLFSQNIIRMIGDSMSVKIEGEPKDQLHSKVTVIRKLLAKLEQKAEAPAVRDPASAPAGAAKPAAAAAAGKEGGGAEGAAAAAPKEAAKDDDKKADILGASGDFPVQSVPTRITERMTDGNYRVRGSQPFMIGSREYKVIVTGVVRAEDFSDDGISSSRLLDSKFDIVSVRRKNE